MRSKIGTKFYLKIISVLERGLILHMRSDLFKSSRTKQQYISEITAIIQRTIIIIFKLKQLKGKYSKTIVNHLNLVTRYQKPRNISIRYGIKLKNGNKSLTTFAGISNYVGILFISCLLNINFVEQ